MTTHYTLHILSCLLVLFGLFGLLLGALARRIAQLNRRLRFVQNALLHLSQQHFRIDNNKLPAGAGQDSTKAGQISNPFEGVEILSPNELLKTLYLSFADGERNAWQSLIDESPAPWSLAYSTHTGQVRDHNEDYCMAFPMNRFQVGLLADGLGGEPYGQYASYFAVKAAALALMKKFEGSSMWLNPTRLMEDAMQAASEEIQSLAEQHNLTKGFRTTLTIVFGTPRRWFLGHIGDGGGLVIQSKGEVKSILAAHKADPQVPNLVSSSLGPEICGSWDINECPRKQGDICIIGSDGIFDKGLDSKWPHDFLHAAFRNQGNLSRTTESFLVELADIQDEHGYLFDDNTSMVVLGDGSSPDFLTFKTDQPPQLAIPSNKGE